jgi:hypothetical protein
MKKLIFLLSLVFVITTINAQSFKDFLKPAKENPAFKTYSVTLDGSSISPWLFRPYIAMNAYQVNLGGAPVNQSFSSVGAGLRYGKFIQTETGVYCQYSFNAMLMTSVKIGGVNSATMGFGLTGDVFNGLIGAGVAYVGNKFMIIVPVSYSF